MTGKHQSVLKFLAYYLNRQSVRWRLRGIVRWPKPEGLEPGCTVIIGMCGAMPDVLVGNLSCLVANAWPEIREIIVVVDSSSDAAIRKVEKASIEVCGSIPIRLLTYTPSQSARADAILLPYVYSWLSWSIALSVCKTRTVLFHDYDALIMSERLGERYHQFVTSGVKVQGIGWYHGHNGFLEEDRLATTFEAFVDVAWLLKFQPIRMFNQIGLINGRSVDYDTLLDLQRNELTFEERAIEPMGEADLVHPSQMVHQYTMFRKKPGAPLPCSAIPMIPFYEFLFAGEASLQKAIEQIKSRRSKTFPFLSQGLLIDFGQLTLQQLDWSLKQITQACVLRKIAPLRSVIDYGNALYELLETPEDRYWVGDFTAEQRLWIEAAASLKAVGV